ncbi:hypothetical protein BD289DRAFT_445760 [Coniella lustricola]|uniref:histidine kinase n=1 Tax=Coniella lustricola TaxID=2025994 RepID=A0A2T2ZUM7_9PEZI|nr:hypothetical protein BD289DRAFT_445760 [Coniella lustricola]
MLHGSPSTPNEALLREQQVMDAQQDIDLPTPPPPGSLANPSAVETIRERETFRYDDLAWTSAAHNDPPALVPSSLLVPSNDQSLTSYAQLGAYRLNAKRALISLFDRDRQHIVAEATRSSPLTTGASPRRGNLVRDDDVDENDRHVAPIARPTTRTTDQEDIGDGLWLCGTAIPRSFGICEHVLLSAGNHPAARSSPTAETGFPFVDPDELPISTIPDLRHDTRFADRPFVSGNPFNYFYAGIPIRTPGPHGMNIGVYCIFDTKPRPDGLTMDEIAFMRDMSYTVMDYLDCRMSSGRFRKSERMVRGMGNFVEGLDSLATAKKVGSTVPKRLPSKSGHRTKGGLGRNSQSKLAMRSKRPDTLIKSLSGGSRVSDESLLSPRAVSFPLASKDQSLLEPSTTSGVKTPRLSQSSMADDSSQCSARRPSSQQSVDGSAQPAVLSQVSTADLQLAETGHVFAKAANIIRQSLEVDGVLFLDATVRSFGGLVGQHSERKTSSVGMDNFNYPSNDEDSASQTPSAAGKDDFANVLGYALPHGSSIAGDGVPWQFEGLRDRTLQKLLRRYPHGRILDFDANGEALNPSVSHYREPLSPIDLFKHSASPLRQGSHDGDDAERSRYRGNDDSRSVPAIRRQKWNAAESIIHLFPGARSIVVIPLWDGQKKRWAAGGFIWTKSPTRVFTADGTLAFSRVFGLIIMAEIYRLNTKADETIKSNILGSISHELRSPLHGLVGAVELLHDSSLDAVQQNVLHIIETSGKTLVDTISHLLDYSKINSYIENEKKDKMREKMGMQTYAKSIEKQAKAQILPVELDCLVEEVVESVLAGFNHERMLGPHAARNAGSYRNYGMSDSKELPSPGSEHSTKDVVQIYLDLELASSWRFLTHPGAFRRIVMNLFGNSLKFTKSGFIKISLAQEASVQDSPATVILTVADSGKGISDDYLQNHLFTPFCQEDHFAPGTGLGLSLVRQIAVNLGGEVKVASQLGQGTTITVTLPLPPAGDEGVTGDAGVNGKHSEALKGCKVLVRGFDSLPASESWPIVHSNEDAGKLLESQAHYVQNTCRDWLGMRILSESEAVDDPPDFIVHHDLNLSFKDGERLAARAPCPVLFVCEATVAAKNFSYNLPDAASRIRTFEFFSSPLGPRKLAMGLGHLLDIWKAKQKDRATAQNGSSAELISSLTGDEGAASDTSDLVILPTEGFDFRGECGSRRPSAVVAEDAAGLDVVALPSSSAPLQRAENSVTPGGPKTPAVLIADDNAINLKILSAYMKKLKLAHVTAVNGLESLTLYSQSPADYSCILTDISMPTMDGLESARRIRQHERARRLKQTPIIALSGLAGVGVQEDAVASGIDMFLTRPVTLKRLTEALETVGLV